jgi:hypothetical protein
MLLIPKEMPTTGQFVAMWVYNGRIWSETCLWDNGVLKHLDRKLDKFVTEKPVLNFDPEDNIQPTYYQYIDTQSSFHCPECDGGGIYHDKPPEADRDE